MSVHSQRGKVKPMSRPRGQRLSTNPTCSPKVPQSNLQAHQDDGSGLFNNSDLNNVLVRHVIGNIGEVTTADNEKVVGVIKAVSPFGDMGLSYTYAPQKQKNGHVNVNTLIIPLVDWKMVRVPNIRLSDCVMGELKTDAELASSCETGGIPADRELVPFFETSETPKDCLLTKGGFPAEEMFKTNKELFSVSTTYNPDLKEYTTQVDRSAPNYAEVDAYYSKIAKNVEDGLDTELHPSDDEETAFSAVTRASTKVQSQNVPGIEKRRGLDQSKTTRPVTSNMLYSPTKVVCLSSLNSSSTIPAEVCTSVEAVSNKVVDLSVSEHDSVLETTPSIAVATPVPNTDDKMKRSTLDPDAPEFHPRSTQHIPNPVSSQPSIQPVVPVPNAHHMPHSSHLPMQSLAPFMQAPQPQMYVSSSMPYGTPSAQVPHLLPNSISAAVNSSIAQQMRAGSLPPSLHHQNFLASLSGPGFFMQHGQQPSISGPQVISSQPSVANQNGRFTGPSSLSLTRQRSSETPTLVPQSSAYGPTQPNIPVSAFHPSVYQFSQPGGAIPLLPGYPHMSFFVPGSAGAATLMVDNMSVPPTSGQSMHPLRTLLQVDQPPSTAPQPSHQPPVFQVNSGHFQDHPYYIQVPSHGHNILFGSQQPNAPNYPITPAILAGANAVNPQMHSGLLPLVNQSNTQHAVLGNIGHHQPPNLEQLPNPQFPLPNCQPQLLPHYVPHQFIQAQQLAASQHMNNQTSAYPGITTMVANGGNQASQPH